MPYNQLLALEGAGRTGKSFILNGLDGVVWAICQKGAL
jgi:hypothetical protein